MKHQLLLTYALAIILAVVIVVYLESAYNQPQPRMSMAYNSLSHTGYGYINNTLSYAISVNYIYCKTPGANKYDFRTSNNDVLQPGSNTFIEVAENSTALLPGNCTAWGVSYSEQPLNTSNSVYIVQTSQNTIVVK